MSPGRAYDSVQVSASVSSSATNSNGTSLHFNAEILVTSESAARLDSFVKWGSAHISGDEKGEAQIYLDRLFQAFGWPGLMDAGARCEERIKNDSGGTAFADLVWKPIVLIEMKRRGVDLARHYRQAFDYWTRLVPGRPRYAVLCNFDEFWVYDFETQMDTPVDKVTLRELPTRFGPLAFLSKEPATPVFGNHQESVTRQAADKLAACFNSMVDREVDRPLAQRFVLQFLMALFSEDIGLLDKYLVVRLLDECKKPGATFDVLGGLFEAMNTPGGVHGGRYKGVAYFNGGLFKVPARVELSPRELTLLNEAARFDWSKVRPEIFGSIFEHSLLKEDRHAYGAHFTSASDIMKIVDPTIVQPWREAIEGARTLKELAGLLERIERFTVLDPACGSGNFLYIAYRELKRLEARIYERMAADYKSVNAAQRPFGFVTARNFFGIDINPFAVELAKVSIMLAHKLAIDELRMNENALPLDNLDGNFCAGDALLTASGQRTPWPKTDVIIGNPPFLGAKRLKPLRGVGYVDAVRDAYPEVPGMADYCVYWFRRTHDELRRCTAADPFTGRAGLVGTQNIRNNESRVGGLDHILQDGTVLEAVDNQPWSGEANVHVSIASWAKTQDPKLLPRRRRLWFTPAGAASTRGADLYIREVRHINSALSDRVDLGGAAVLTTNKEPQMVFQGVTPGHRGFVLDEQTKKHLIEKDPRSRTVIRPYLVGDEILSGAAKPTRHLLDFQQRSLLEAKRFKAAFSYVEKNVLPHRRGEAEKGKDAEGKMRPHHKKFLERWWQLSWGRADMLSVLSKLPRYLVCSRVTKRPIFAFLSSAVRPGDALQVFAFSDDYSFGILQSSMHWQWFIAKCSKLKADFRYTPDSVFDTFPWPQSPSSRQVEAVAAAAREIHKIRGVELSKDGGSLRSLYRTLELPGANPLRIAHDALDEAVLNAYGFSAREDLLSQLLSLNGTVADNIEHLQPVMGPGIPPKYPNPKALVSDYALGSVGRTANVRKILEIDAAKDGQKRLRKEPKKASGTKQRHSKRIA